MLTRKDEENNSDRVNLLTLHAAKGLEFPYVFILGMEEELLPLRNSIDTDAIEDERRLAYVGLTRAQRLLTLTLSKQRRRYKELIDCQPSRFLEELPKDLVVWEGLPGPVKDQCNVNNMASAIFSVKAMLNTNN